MSERSARRRYFACAMGSIVAIAAGGALDWAPLAMWIGLPLAIASGWFLRMFYDAPVEEPWEAPWEDDDDLCAQCGDLMEWTDCFECDDGVHQPMLDDLGPWPDDPWVRCDGCGGNGGWYWCPRGDHQPADNATAATPGRVDT